MLYTKGADSVVEKRLAHSDAKNETWNCLTDWAQKGLRTLILARRIIP